MGGLPLLALLEHQEPPIPGFLSWHMLLETLSIVVAALIFAVGWHTRTLHRQGNVLLASCAFLGVAVLDFSHMLSFPGMPDFVTPSDVEKGIHFWLPARYLAAFALLAMIWRPWPLLSPSDMPNSPRWHRLFLPGVLLLLLPVHWLALWQPELIPATYLPGSGLTLFKQLAELGVVAVLLLVIAVLLTRLREPSQLNIPLLLLSLLAMTLGELPFAVYRSATDVYNLGGHVYKLVAYLLLYQAIFVQTIATPYRALEQARQHNQAILDAIPDALFELDGEGRYLAVHTASNELLRAPPEQLLGRNLRDVLPSEAATICLEAFAEARRHGRSSGHQLTLALPDGSERRFELSVSHLLRRDSADEHFIVLSRDITQRSRDQQRIDYLAHFDPLTGLPNRVLFQSRLEQVLGIAERHGRPLALLFLDIDHFKYINDSLGHRIGDVLLKQIARRLQAALRDEDTLSRQGGDEFMLCLPDTNAAGAVHTAERLRTLLALPFAVQEHTLTVSASIGIALYPQDGDDCEQLTQHADAAMYRAKQEGRDRYRLFTAELQAQSLRTLSLENALRQALERNELQLYYQPQVDCRNRLCGIEALLRWQHPQLGPISPGEFIPVAEGCGLIVPIGHWVLREAVRQRKAWRDCAWSGDLRLSVNLSLAQFNDPQLETTIEQVLSDSGLQAQHLELELTESVAMHQPERVIALTQRLSQRGVHLAIDDFGTGYSSLNYLKRLEVHKLKIDQSFVRHLEDDDSDRSIVQAIIGLAHNLGMRVIAEGVESAAQYQLLTQLGCDEMQGYLFSPALPAEAFTAWASAWQLQTHAPLAT
nr:EAL domain-containing protein [Pseudomonas sp. NW5]